MLHKQSTNYVTDAISKVLEQMRMQYLSVLLCTLCVIKRKKRTGGKPSGKKGDRPELRMYRTSRKLLSWLRKKTKT